MPEILINVINKIPQLSGDIRQITADNADYTIRFAFDNDWREGEKRVYFVRENGFAYPVGRTTEDVAPVPSVNGVKLRTSLFVGVQQGSVKTSRPCMIPVYHAITDMIDDSAVQPEPSMWEDVLKRLEKLEKNGGGSGGTAFETGALIYKGSVAFASLPALSAENVGHVYNVTNAFVTTANFLEGAGHSYAAGQNVAVANAGNGVYRYDVLAQPIDLSGYVLAEDLVEIDNAAFDELWNSVMGE